MSLNKVKLSSNLDYNSNFTSNIRAAQNYMHEAATSRSMSNKRLFSTIFSLLFGLFMAYSSFFYFPAYSSKSSIIMVAGQNNSSPINQSSTLVDNQYLNYLLMNQGYLKVGQGVNVNYQMPPGAELNLNVIKCSGPAVVEIYSCRGTIIKTLKVTQDSKMFDLTIGESGFYKFEQTLTDTSPKISSYKVVWKRK